MSYIGRGIDQIDNISTLDNLSFNGSSATFNLTQNSVAFVPVSADALQIQIDGVIQSGNYTVSGSTVTFDFTPSGSSVCNGIRHFGVGLITSVSDGAITNVKLGADSVNGSKIADSSISDEHLDITAITGQTAITSLADTDKFLVSDASDSGNLKYVEKQYLGGGTLVPISSVALSGNTNPIIFDDVFTDTYNLYQIHLNDLCPTIDGVSVRFRFRDGSSTLSSSNTYEHCSATVQSDSTSWTIKAVNNDDNIQIGRDSVGHSAATSGISGIIQVPNPRSTGNYANMHYDLKSADGDGFTLYKLIGAGAFKGGVATAVEGFVLTTSNNGFTSGRIDIYGVKNA
jgi:hypothetical protein